MPDMAKKTISDIFIIGGGINGCGIARDAAGRGLSVTLAEMNDLGWATSSSSTKLFHGGLRYLEYLEVRLVREALTERETLLRAMPHISWPMRFVLPYHKDMRFESDTPVSKLLSFALPWMKGRRPAWLIRLGLFMYDHLGGRKILPGTTTLSLRDTPEGAPLKTKFERAYEYSDCWVEDARLVVLNARDAVARGACILPRTQVIRTTRRADHWDIETKDTENGRTTHHKARILINAAGPWVGDMIEDVLDITSQDRVMLVRGSHIVTPKLFDHGKAYFFQGEDGRIIFAIPYETDFTLIGTTDAPHENPDTRPVCTEDEQQYLIDFANQYFRDPITRQDVVWSYSGVRPLFDDGASSATAATREYVLKINAEGGAPVLNIFGGKITTYRRLAENVLAKLAPNLAKPTATWTSGVALPGGDFPVDGVEALLQRLKSDYPFLTDRWAARLIRAYGTEAWTVLGRAQSKEELGIDFGATLTEREVKWLKAEEFAQTAEDILWRRSKLGLRMSAAEVTALEHWMAAPSAST